MPKNKVGAIAMNSFVVLIVLGAVYPAMAKDAKTPDAKMAPIEQYLMADQGAEIALARSAAPESISRDAEVMVMGRHGFETAVKGKNGFVCIVERSWTAAADSDFWDPRVRVPMCLNAAASHSYLAWDLKATDLILEGRTKAQMEQTIFAAGDRKELPAMEPGAMCYMMSKQGFGGDTIPHWPSHLMFFYSNTDSASWGANLPGSPVVAVTDPRAHLTSFVVAVERWSDGTQAR